MNDLMSSLRHQERRLLNRFMPDRDDEIGAIDRLMDVIAFARRQRCRDRSSDAPPTAPFPIWVLKKGCERDERNRKAPVPVEDGLHPHRTSASGDFACKIRSDARLMASGDGTGSAAWAGTSGASPASSAATSSGSSRCTGPDALRRRCERRCGPASECSMRSRSVATVSSAGASRPRHRQSGNAPVGFDVWPSDR